MVCDVSHDAPEPQSPPEPQSDADDRWVHAETCNGCHGVPQNVTPPLTAGGEKPYPLRWLRPLKDKGRQVVRGLLLCI